jgi:hypothetical protein
VTRTHSAPAFGEVATVLKNSALPQGATEVITEAVETRGKWNTAQEAATETRGRKCINFKTAE